MLNQKINHGFCECGCGQLTKLAKVNNAGRGYIRNQPLRFIHGHNRTRQRISTEDYHIVDMGFTSHCWIWSHYLSPHGYGKVGWRGKVRLAHVVMYEQEIGQIPSNAEIDHLCRIPACIRPDHLEAVGHRENVRRGRARKLSDQQVSEIRNDQRSSYAIAKDYGITPSYAWKLKTRRVRNSALD